MSSSRGGKYYEDLLTSGLSWIMGNKQGFSVSALWNPFLLYVVTAAICNNLYRAVHCGKTYQFYCACVCVCEAVESCLWKTEYPSNGTNLCAKAKGRLRRFGLCFTIFISIWFNKCQVHFFKHSALWTRLGSLLDAELKKKKKKKKFGRPRVQQYFCACLSTSVGVYRQNQPTL